MWGSSSCFSRTPYDRGGRPSPFTPEPEISLDQTTPLSSAAVYYQEETKYSRTTIHRFRSLDYSKKPPQFKDFQSESPISLVPFLPFTHIPFTRTPIPTPLPQPPTPWGLADLSRLLFFSYGVTAIMDSPKIDKTYMRAAPSAGGLYPAEIYLAIWDQPFMADGIYHYQGKEHHLVPVYEGSFREKLNACFLHAPALLDASFLILVSGIYERSSWRYGERGYRRILLDAGHLVANLELMAQETGFMAYPLSGFQDAFLNSLLFLGDQTEVALTGLAMVFEDLSFEPIPCKPFLPSPPHPAYSPPELPETGDLFRDLHRLSSIGPDPFIPSQEALPGDDDYDPTVLPVSRFAPQRDPVLLGPGGVDLSDNISRDLLTRRSARHFSGEPLPFDDLSTILSYGYNLSPDLLPDPTVPPLFFGRSLFSSYLVVHSVDGLLPGLYHFAPETRALSLLRRGNMAEIACEFSLGQDLVRDASCVLIHAADLPRLVARYGNRIYRTLHMDTGIIGERINLASVRLDRGSSGIGGFFDDEIAEFLGLPTTTAILYLTVIGMIPKP